MLLVVSPNLCLDRILVVPRFTPGRVHRVQEVIRTAGGKGMNVARAATALGVPCTVVGFLAGQVGHQVFCLATQEGIRIEPVWVSGEGRVCTIVVDPEGEETVLNEPGPAVAPSDVEALEATVLGYIPGARIVVLCGSLPPGAPEDLYGRLLARLRGIPSVVDAAGSVLRQAVRSGPLLAKANRAELEAAVGHDLAALEELAGAAQVLRAWGAHHVLVTLGQDGALLVGEDRLLFRPPRVPRRNTVGAGDSFTAGLCVGWLRGASLPEAVRWGMAAAASDVSTLLGGHVDPSHLKTLVGEVTVQPL